MKPAFKHSEYAATSACSEYWKCCWTCVSLWVLCAFEGRVMWNSVRLVSDLCAREETALSDVKCGDGEAWRVLLWDTESVQRQSAEWWCSQERVRELWLFWWHLKIREAVLKRKQRQDEDVRKSSPDQGTVAIQCSGGNRADAYSLTLITNTPKWWPCSLKSTTQTIDTQSGAHM